jgi:MSHA biogenesis protein MshN
MSLINQVLNDLEKRGTLALPGEPAIRPVSMQRNWRKAAMAAAAIIVLIAAVLWLGSLQRKTVGPSTGANVVQAPSLPVDAPPPSQPLATAAQEAPKIANRQKTGAPASHLSFELKSIPLPSSLRAKLRVPASAQAGRKAALSPLAVAPTAEAITPVAAPPSANLAAGNVDKQIKQVSMQQLAEIEFRKATGLMQQGRVNEAISGYEAALKLDAGHEAARQAMVGLLLESKRNADAERVLQDGLDHNPKHSGFAMLLARLQVERNELAQALETLQKTLPYAGQQADYQAFIAALLQRQAQHKAAVAHYQAALQLSPGSGIWLMGLGISLQALQRNEEARDAFKSALETRSLSAELQAFVAQRLKQL